MKRGKLIIAILIIVLAIALLSLLLFPDFWNKITGGAIGITGNLKGCVDSDGGKNLNVKGTTNLEYTYTSKGYTDSCSDNNVLTEYYCDSDNNAIVRHVYTCENECIDGACI